MKAVPRSHWIVVVLLALVGLAAIPSPTRASHSWSTYHWARTSNEFTVKVIDSMTTAWDGHLDDAIGDDETWGATDATAEIDGWYESSVLNVVKEPGDSSARTTKRCPAVSGKVRSCNAEYGRNGWLGLASVWVSSGHIVQATAKMNDTYFNTDTYNDPIKKQHVVCQEIGHDWGLGHQDESGADLDTCMDYSRALDNPEPNAHDYQQLETIYNDHLDSSNSVASMPADVANAELNTPAEWGKLVHTSGRVSIYERDFGGGFRIVTFVTWADEDARASASE